jgi:hypothetical protein
VRDDTKIELGRLHNWGINYLAGRAGMDAADRDLLGRALDVVRQVRWVFHRDAKCLWCGRPQLEGHSSTCPVITVLEEADRRADAGGRKT